MWAVRLPTSHLRNMTLPGVAILLALLAGCSAPPPEHTAAISRMQGLGGKVLFADGGFRVNLSNSRVADDDLKELRNIQNLKGLDLTNTRITDQGLKQIEALKSVTSLTLTGTPTTRDAREALRKARPDMTVRN
jgi:hypothetical protein